MASGHYFKAWINNRISIQFKLAKLFFKCYRYDQNISTEESCVSTKLVPKTRCGDRKFFPKLTSQHGVFWSVTSLFRLVFPPTDTLSSPRPLLHWLFFPYTFRGSHIHHCSNIEELLSSGLGYNLSAFIPRDLTRHRACYANSFLSDSPAQTSPISLP